MYAHVADCSTGEQTLVEMTEDEQATHTALQEQLSNQALYEQHQREQSAEQREAAIATLKAHLPEEAHAALLTLLAGG